MEEPEADTQSFRVSDVETMTMLRKAYRVTGIVADVVWVTVTTWEDDSVAFMTVMTRKYFNSIFWN